MQLGTNDRSEDGVGMVEISYIFVMQGEFDFETILLKFNTAIGISLKEWKPLLTAIVISS